MPPRIYINIDIKTVHMVLKIYSRIYIRVNIETKYLVLRLNLKISVSIRIKSLTKSGYKIPAMNIVGYSLN